MSTRPRPLWNRNCTTRKAKKGYLLDQAEYSAQEHYIKALHVNKYDYKYTDNMNIII